MKCEYVRIYNIVFGDVEGYKILIIEDCAKLWTRKKTKNRRKSIDIYN